MLVITRRRDGEEEEDEKEVVFTENVKERCRKNDSGKIKLPVT